MVRNCLFLSIITMLPFNANAAELASKDSVACINTRDNKVKCGELIFYTKRYNNCSKTRTKRCRDFNDLRKYYNRKGKTSVEGVPPGTPRSEMSDAELESLFSFSFPKLDLE